MISCHYNCDGASQATAAQIQQQPGPHVLHQQTSMYTHVSPVFGAPYTSNDYLMNNSNQLVRSKSLNDISNNSQSQAFGQGRSTCLELIPSCNNAGGDISNFDPQHMVQSNLNSSSHNTNINAATPSMSTVDTANNPIYSVYNNNYQQCTRNNLESVQSCNNTNLNNHHQFETNQDLNWNTSNAYGNECSNNNRTSIQSMPTVTAGQTAPPATAPATMFNICNPLAMNLNGVTEQIGNLHL